ncbi:hypothetical protein B0T22DRAFT_184790 [Podospora appendiculata]|uniref:Uncharacterized protein n=1 Tax=Podospora appendiculata TaxID=314037 RepID=A0AAE1CE24_9PEZI|nr:hypothetical protein B0T22DRAFT_184790 [Podospora appendiculata]
MPSLFFTRHDTLFMSILFSFLFFVSTCLFASCCSALPTAVLFRDLWLAALGPRMAVHGGPLHEHGRWTWGQGGSGTP